MTAMSAGTESSDPSRTSSAMAVRDDVVHLVLAGLGNSSPGHWQRAWAELLPNVVWLEHASWDSPDEASWLADLRRFLQQEERPVVAITHSLGCSLLAAWATGRGLDGIDPAHWHDGETPVVAAFVVAPPNSDRDDFPPQVTGFRSLEFSRLPFPATVVHSTNDPYCDATHGQQIAAAFGDAQVEVGDQGHINSESNLGDWPQGQQAFADLMRRLAAKDSSAR